MANERPMSDKPRGANYHDAHLDDPGEWDESSPEDVTPQPSGMTVLSLRLPTDEFAFLKREAEARKTTMSELTRSALRFYLFPRASGSLSATAIHKLHVTTMTPPGWAAWWTRELRSRQIPAAAPLGNVDPRPVGFPS